ncbi:MAG TPA: outer membrane lipid asymmetry maintenance protein MlaD [Gammaproteobacteria bacterium]|nr:outer membrane lipid asymmetry maintenance protein MlaD [Gammaproteobacteria bacterium]
MTKKVIEILVGFFMILGIIALIFLAIKVSGLTTYTSKQSFYTVTAEFDNVGGLKVRAPVMIAGVWVGEVKGIELDRTSFRAKVLLSLLKSKNNLPSDTSANIYTQGLLGANYVNLNPGYADTFLKQGSVIESTQPAVILEKLIGQFIYNMENNGNKK